MCVYVRLIPQVTLDVSAAIDVVTGTLSITISNSFPVAVFQFCIVDADGQPLPTSAAMSMQGVQFDTQSVPSEMEIVADGSNEFGKERDEVFLFVLDKASYVKISMCALFCCWAAKVIVIESSGDGDDSFEIAPGMNQPFITLIFDTDALPDPPEACLTDVIFASGDLQFGKARQPSLCMDHYHSDDYILTMQTPASSTLR